MKSTWAAADAALRSDPHMVADLAEAAHDAVRGHAAFLAQVEREAQKAARRREGDQRRAAAITPEAAEARRAKARAANARRIAAMSADELEAHRERAREASRKYNARRAAKDLRG